MNLRAERQDLEERAVGDRVDEWMADVMSRDRRWIHSALPSDVVNVPKTYPSPPPMSLFSIGSTSGFGSLVRFGIRNVQ